MALIGCALAVSACGSERTVAHDPSPPPVPGDTAPAYVVELPADQLSMAEDLRTLYERFAGDVVDHQAAAVISAYSLNADQQECVEGQGLTWFPGWEGAISGVELRAWYGASVELVPPVRTATFDDLVNADASRLGPLRGFSPPPAVDQALGECSFHIDGYGRILDGVDDGIGQLTHPGAADELGRAWWQVMGDAVEDVGSSPEDIWSCFTDTAPRAPFDDIEPGREGARWWAHVERMVPSGAQIPTVRDDPADRAWASVLEQEEALAWALWDCHAEDYGEVLAAAHDAAETFALEHADGFARADAAWARTREIATRMGWAPDKPLAGLTGVALEVPEGQLDDPDL